MKAIITTIMINTANPDRLIDFWTKLLDVGVKYQIDNYTWLNAGEGNGVAIGFQKVGQIPNHKSSIHFDIAVEDKTHATELVKKLGGSLISEQSFNNIMADPDGNLFCVYVHQG